MQRAHRARQLEDSLSYPSKEVVTVLIFQVSVLYASLHFFWQLLLATFLHKYLYFTKPTGYFRFNLTGGNVISGQPWVSLLASYQVSGGVCFCWWLLSGLLWAFILSIVTSLQQSLQTGAIYLAITSRLLSLLVSSTPSLQKGCVPLLDTTPEQSGLHSRSPASTIGFSSDLWRGPPDLLPFLCGLQVSLGLALIPGRPLIQEPLIHHVCLPGRLPKPRASLHLPVFPIVIASIIHHSFLKFYTWCKQTLPKNYLQSYKGIRIS